MHAPQHHHLPIYIHHHHNPPLHTKMNNPMAHPHHHHHLHLQPWLPTPIYYTPTQPFTPMFEKPLTPSDVGKLNRLVIPKQHAEKHFPLGTDNCDKGLVLSFEDDSGKQWRFRYSYWTSSQSYVLTKGWSRFVKEKRLDAGDIVLFRRIGSVGDRLFIGCRRRDESPPPMPRAVYCSGEICSHSGSPCGSSLGCGSSSSVQHHGLHAEIAESEEASAVAAATPATTKRLRLFGVNLDLTLEPDASYYYGHNTGQVDD